jgi:hypothetical protein
MSYFLTPKTHEITESSSPLNLRIVSRRLKRWGWNIPSLDRSSRDPLMIFHNTADRLFAVENPSMHHEWCSPTRYTWLQFKKFRHGVEIRENLPHSWVNFSEGIVRMQHKGHVAQEKRTPCIFNPAELRIARVNLEVIPYASTHMVPGMDGRWHFTLYLVPNRWYFVYDFGNEFVIAYR